MKISFSSPMIFLWLILPAVNFFTWYYISTHGGVEDCTRDATSNSLKSSPLSLLAALPCPANLNESSSSKSSRNRIAQSELGISGHKDCNPIVHPDYREANIQEILTSDFDDYRALRLAPMTMLKGGQSGFGSRTTIIKPFGPDLGTGINPNSVCDSYMVMVRDVTKCGAVVKLNNIGDGALNVLRYDQDIDENNLKISTFEKEFGIESKNYKKNAKITEKLFVGNKNNFDYKSTDLESNQFGNQTFRPTGLYRKIPKDRGHDRTKEKLGPFVKYFDGQEGIEKQFKDLLEKNNVKAGDDLVVMVVNEGEIDLYLNFACSCRLHNITTKNVFVFAASSEIVTIIESTGAMGIYHEGYSSVSKKASTDYLDRVFVDMMWYKAFSVYLMLRMRINVLFQDADLVWFRDPFPYFKEYGKDKDGNVIEKGSENIEAFFSDDGQRSLRYSPFYANSGFYYLLANERTEYFAWSIMTSFDAVQVLGSHQNVLTMRLVEEFSLSAKHVKILPLTLFPGGVMYHHDHGYMKALREGREHPYGFHMCWTQGKPDKLIYLRKAKMWYLKDTCSPLENLTPKGHVFGNVTEKLSHSTQLRWDHLSDMCCNMVPGAP